MLEMTEVTLVVGCDIGRPIGGSLKQREVNLQYTEGERSVSKGEKDKKQVARGQERKGR